MQGAYSSPGPAPGLTPPGDRIDIGSHGAAPAPSHQQMAVGDFRTQLNSAIAAPDGMPGVLPPGRFDLSSDGTNVIFDGRGWGHGIGMSQYGALGKALPGLKATDILAAYYAGLR